MSDISHLITGLIIGDTLVNRPKPTHVGRVNNNIPLQDVIFLQCLSNTITRLDTFIKSDGLSPQELVAAIILLQRKNVSISDIKSSNAIPFQVGSPLTDEEDRLIREFNNDVECYSKKWESDEWSNLTVVQRIWWQDKRYTPDLHNLDLLIAPNGHNRDTVRNDGSLYEYDNVGFPPLNGIAKKYFNTFPSNILYAICVKRTSEELKNRGYVLDLSRTQNNKPLPNSFDVKEDRARAYKRLKKEQPELCETNDWADFIREVNIIERCNDALLQSKRVSSVERDKRRAERKQIEKHLTRKEFNGIGNNLHYDGYTFTTIFALISMFLAAICSLSGIIILSLSENYEALEIVGILLLTIGAIWFIVQFFVFIVGKQLCFSHFYAKRRLKIIQHLYYEDNDDPIAAEYAELLKRI